MYRCKQIKNEKFRSVDTVPQFDFMMLKQVPEVVDGVVMNTLKVEAYEAKSDSEIKWQDFSVANLAATGALDSLKPVQLDPDNSGVDDLDAVNARLDEFIKQQTHDYSQVSLENS